MKKCRAYEEEIKKSKTQIIDLGKKNDILLS